MEAAIKAFLYQHMYRHKRVMRVMGEAEGIVADLFARYRQSPGDLPPEWLEGTGGETEAGAGAPDRQFHCRDDRPFCADRAPKAF